MKKTLHIVVALFCCSLTHIAFSQENTANYIRTRTMLAATGDSCLDKVAYYDGIGRLYQTVNRNFTSSRGTFLDLQEYDEVGRLSVNWLPVDNISETIPPVGFRLMSPVIYKESSTFHKTVYEESPLNRVTKQYGPGAAWTTHPVVTEYLTNTADVNCVCYSVNLEGALTQKDNYPLGTLYVTKTTDEDGNISYVFIDKERRTLLTRQMAASVAHDTYYVYDVFGNLCYVLQPMYKTMVDLPLYAFQYKYDSSNRCIEKKLPGIASVKYRYDDADRLIFSQDGNQQKGNQWTFMFYDGFGREIVRGLCTGTPLGGISSAKTTLDHPGGCCFHCCGYTLPEGLGVTYSRFYTTKYYDDYTFFNITPISGRKDYFRFKQEIGYGEANMLVAPKGLLTGMIETDTESESFRISAFYYDSKGQLVQQLKERYLGGLDIDSYAYSFSGKVIKHKSVHSGLKDSLTEAYTYQYDHVNRLKKVTHQLGTKTPVTLATLEYDRFGRLNKKHLHNAKIPITYSCNVRNWTDSIHSPYFTQKLHYTDGVNPVKCFNGNISSMTWRGNDNVTRGYKFSYDGLSRLLNAAYGETSVISANSNRFTENVTAYDKNGNIKALQRYGQTAASTYGLIDNMTYTLSGNQLNRVDDAVTAAAYNSFFEFKDAVKQAGEYAYDANGNLTKDLNKGISGIQYNVLNLPKTIVFNDGRMINYVYRTDGTKLRVTNNIGSPTMDYCGNLVYENGIAKLLLTEEGYISLTDSKYHYYLQDHQGNNRVVVDQSGAVEETNHYYPFGGVFAGSTTVQPYKYNGKELDTKKGLNWYDYGARQYDAALGRFTSEDPLAEKYYSMSQYAYCLNNPVKYVDPTGGDVVIWYKDDSGRQTSFRFNGKNATKAPNSSFVKDVISAYNYNVNNGGGENLKEIATSTKFAVSVVGTDKDNKYDERGFIRFNPNAGLQLEDGNSLSPATGLEHEAAHAVNDKIRGLDLASDRQYGTKEERNVIRGAELKTAKANGELPSGHHGRKSHSEGEWIVTKSVTSNVEKSLQESERLRVIMKNFKNRWTSE